MHGATIKRQMPLAFPALIVVKNSFFAGDVGSFYTKD
jgi:hypothetical protein